jgi:hypothetical protein
MLLRTLAALAAFAVVSCSRETTTTEATTTPDTTTTMGSTTAPSAQPAAPAQQAMKSEVDRVRNEQVGPNAQVVEEQVFLGDFNGDGVEDAVAHYFINGQPAGATLVPGPVAMVMVNKDGRLQFVRAQAVPGDNPRDARFSDGSVTITTDVNGVPTQHTISTR